MSYRRLLCLIATGLGLAAAMEPPQAEAQSVLRSQTRQTQRAIQQNTRQAVKPRLVIRSAVPGGVQGLTADRAGRLVATLLGDATVRLWDLGLGVELGTVALPGGITALDAAPDGKLVALGGGNRVRLARPGGSLQTTDIAVGTAVAALRVTGNGLVVVGSASGDISVWRADGGTAVTAWRAASSGPVTALAASPDGRIASGDGQGNVTVWDAGGARLQDLRGDGRIVALAFDGSRLAAAGGELAVWDAGGRKLWNTDVKASSVAFAGDSVVVGGTDGKLSVFSGTGTRLISVAAHDKPITGLAVTAGSRDVLSASAEGITRQWALADGRLLALVISTQGGWAALDPKGRYDGSLQGVFDVAWQVDGPVLPVDNFSALYYEPGLLATLQQPGPRFLTDPAALDDGVLPPPAVTLSLDTAPSGESLARVDAEDKGAGIAAVRLFLNGRRVPETAIVQQDRGAQRWQLTYRLNGAAAVNVVSAVAEGENGIEGETAEKRFNLPTPPDPTVMHIVGFAVNDYPRPSDRLMYAVPDAQSIAKELKATAQRLYPQVATRLLLNKKASKAGVLQTLGDLRTIPPKDIVVLYMAGHGVDLDGTWYFIPADVGSVTTAAEVRARGLSAAELETAIGQLQAQRVILMVDACRSGALIGTLSPGLDRRQLKEVSRQSGIHLLAATQRNQDALEFDSLGHGAFTYVVLMALRGGRKTVSARELIGYVERKLPGFTREQLEKILAGMPAQSRGAQLDSIPIPTPVAFSRGADFPLAQGR